MRTLSKARTDFIDFLQLVFSKGKVKTNGQTFFRWEEDDKRTKILIKGSNVTNPETLNKTPAILVSRGDVKPDPASKGLHNNIISHNWDDRYSTHAFVMGGPIIFSCLAPNEEEAETIAQIVFTILEKNKPYLREKYLYRSIVLQGIGKPRILKYEGEGTKLEVWNCGVIAMVNFQFGYKYKQEEDGIGEIEFSNLAPPISWLDREE